MGPLHAGAVCRDAECRPVGADGYGVAARNAGLAAARGSAADKLSATCTNSSGSGPPGSGQAVGGQPGQHGAGRIRCGDRRQNGLRMFVVDRAFGLGDRRRRGLSGIAYSSAGRLHRRHDRHDQKAFAAFKTASTEPTVLAVG